MTTAKQKYPKLMGLWNTIDNSRSLREVFLSMSIQHGQYNVVSLFVDIHRKISVDDEKNNKIIRIIRIIRIII